MTLQTVPSLLQRPQTSAELSNDLQLLHIMPTASLLLTARTRSELFLILQYVMGGLLDFQLAF